MSKTSWQVKARYNAKHYKRIGVDLPAELVDEFKEKCKKEGVSQARVICEFVEKYLENKENANLST